MSYPGQPVDDKPPAYHQPPAQPMYNQPPAQPMYNQTPAQPMYNQPPAQPMYNQPPQGGMMMQPQHPQMQNNQNTNNNINNTIVMAQPAAATVIVQQTAPQPPNYLGLAIFVLICCNFVFGIIALICSISSSSAYGDQDYEGARSKGKVSCGLSVAGMLITVFSVIFVMIYFFVIVPAAIFG